MARTESPSYTIRPYADDDERRVLDLLTTTLGGGPAGRRPPEFFRWKHLDNPFGRSFMLLAEVDRQLIGFRSFMRWRFQVGGATVRAVRAVDTATHPDFQGRGVFSRLTLEALEALGDEIDLVFNTPNDRSLPGYLKMGWHMVGRIPVHVRVRHPVRLARHRRSLKAVETTVAGTSVEAERATDVLEDEHALNDLLSRAETPETLIHTVRTLDYLRWRYGDAPLLDYRAVRDHRGGALRGLAIFRVRPRGHLREATIAELIVPPGDASALRRLARAVVRSAPVDHAVAHLPYRTAARHNAWKAGFVRSPVGPVFVVNAIGQTSPDPEDLRSWALSLGDVEVF
jgi:GNAT superfamily N-acetyltransferase